MKTRKLSFDNFIENELSVVGMKSVKGGLYPDGSGGTGTVPLEEEPIDPTESTNPQNGAPIVIVIPSGHIKVDSTGPIVVVVKP